VRRTWRTALVVLVCALATVACASCGEQLYVAQQIADAPVMPGPADLSTPTSTVESYLAWVTYAYRQMDSSLPSATMTPDEGVHVDAYIQFNLQKNRGIDQQLLSMKVRSVSEEETSAIVAASEEWRYRYFTPSTLVYLGPENLVSYETTYSLVRTGDSWLVGAVEAKALGEVP
jgi:hypothetical protein